MKGIYWTCPECANEYAIEKDSPAVVPADMAVVCANPECQMEWIVWVTDKNALIRSEFVNRDAVY